MMTPGVPEASRLGASDRSASGRLLVASNRLPTILLRSGSDGCWETRPAAGGLVAGLRPILETHGGVWIGWPGVIEDLLADADFLAHANRDP